MKKLLGITCLLWLAAAQAQGSEMPVTPAKPLTLQEAWTLAEQNSISLKVGTRRRGCGRGPRRGYSRSPVEQP